MPPVNALRASSAIRHFTFAILLTSVGSLAADDVATRPTLYIIGDSTVKNGTPGQQGWGDPLAELFDQARLKIENRARGGRSSRTFLTEGLWDRVVADLKPGDFVLMQFGHNDGGPLTGVRARASLKGSGDESREVVHERTELKENVRTYGWYLRKYAADAVGRGATPIVLSPVPRNIWKAGSVSRAANDYGKWAAEAASSEKVLFIDLNELVARRYEAVGPEQVAQSYFGRDHTHTTAAGAELTADVLARAIAGLKDCRLSSYLLAKEVVEKEAAARQE